MGTKLKEPPRSKTCELREAFAGALNYFEVALILRRSGKHVKSSSMQWSALPFLGPWG